NVFASWAGWAENSGLWGERSRCCARYAARQSRHMAVIHGPRLDRSHWDRLEPHGQTGRRKEFLEHTQRCQFDGQGNRTLPCQEQSHRLAEISFWRELWRFSRRLKGARFAK